MEEERRPRSKKSTSTGRPRNPGGTSHPGKEATGIYCTQDLADEPTANLDSTTGHEVIDWLSRLNGEHGITIVFASHDPMIISAAKRSINIVDGLIASDVTP